MNKPLNVVELEVLLKFYYSPQAHLLMVHSPAVQEAKQRLISCDMIVCPDTSESEAHVTSRGKFYLEHLLKQPYPVVEQVYKIPEAS